jgi:hypothetical protein
MVNILRTLSEKLDNLEGQMDNAKAETQVQGKNSKGM